MGRSHGGGDRDISDGPPEERNLHRQSLLPHHYDIMSPGNQGRDSSRLINMVFRGLWADESHLRGVISVEIYHQP